MAGYTRQSSFSNGSVIDATDFESEYNALEAAFNGSTGHTHDGTAGNGPPIESMGPSNDLVVTASVTRPKTTNVMDLGTSSILWKDGYFDGTLNTDILTVDETSTLTGDVTASANVSVGGTLTVTGDVTLNGNIDLGDAAADAISFLGTVDTAIVPDTDNTRDLGSAANEWRDLYLTGTANIDSLVADTADIDGGTIDGAVIGGTSTAAITGTTITGTSLVGPLTGDVTGDLTGDVTGAVTGNVKADDGTVVLDSGTNGTDSTYTGDVTGDLTGNVTSTGANTMASLTTTGNVNVGGALDVTGNSQLDGNLIVDGNLTVNGTQTTINTATLQVEDKNIVLGEGLATATAANGGGITLDGADATILYDSVADRWDFNKDIEVANVYADVTGDLTGDVAGDLTGDIFSTTGDITARAESGDSYFTIDNQGGLLFDYHTLKLRAAKTNSGQAEITSSNTLDIATTSGSITLDSAQDIVLDAAGDDIIFKEAGVLAGSIGVETANTMKFKAGTSEEMRLTTGGVAITNGLYVGSATGTPTDNDIYAEADITAANNLSAGNDILMTAGTSDWKFEVNASNELVISYGGTNLFKISTTGAVTAADDVTASGTL